MNWKLAVAFLASMPVQAVAECHHYKQWNFPYPQKCGGDRDSAPTSREKKSTRREPGKLMAEASAATCTLYLMTPTGVITVAQDSVEAATAQYWQYSENYPDVVFEALYCGKVLKLIEDESNTKGIPNFGHLDPGSVPK